MRGKSANSGRKSSMRDGPSRPTKPEAKPGLAVGGLMRAGMAKPPPRALPETAARIVLGEETSRARRRDRVSPQRYIHGPCRSKGGGWRGYLGSPARYE